MVQINEIVSKDWSMSLANPGEIVTDLQDIEQCILIICTTVRGSDPLRPEFGSNIVRHLDRPRNVGVPNIVIEIAEAIEIWETRAVLNAITYSFEQPEHVTFFIDWQTLDGRKPGQPMQITFNI